jgi:hypothetical protein
VFALIVGKISTIAGNMSVLAAEQVPRYDDASMALLLWILHAVTVALWLSCREMRSGKLTSTARRAAFLDACGTEFGAAAADVVSCAAVLACWRASHALCGSSISQGVLSIQVYVGAICECLTGS